MRIGVDSAPRPLVASPFQELAPALSPDGRWLAYTSNETGRREVYVRPFPDVGAGKAQVSTAGGSAPRWSHRGDELFYRTLNDDFMAARVRLAPTFRMIGQRRLFSAAGYTPGLDHATFDVAPDDRRFLMLRVGSTAGGEDAAPHLILVQNFRRPQTHPALRAAPRGGELRIQDGQHAPPYLPQPRTYGASCGERERRGWQAVTVSKDQVVTRRMLNREDLVRLLHHIYRTLLARGMKAGSSTRRTTRPAPF